MRVGINGYFWPQENTGSGQYTRQLWQALHEIEDQAQLDERVDYTLLGYPPAANLSDVADHQKRLSQPPGLIERGGPKATKLWWEQSGLPALARNQKEAGSAFDVIHWPYFAASLVAPPRPCATIITIHDVIPLLLPEYAPSLPWKAYFELVSRAARRATLVLADSEHSRQDILRVLKLPLHKVETVYLGSDRLYQPGHLMPERRADLLQKYGLNGQERLIFYIGGFDQRKNVPMLIEAFGRAVPRLKQLEAADPTGRPWTLGLAGIAHSANSTMYPDLQEAIKQGLPEAEAGRVHFLGRVDEADKPDLYRAAEMFVFPSRYEGFGIPPLDALGCGVPTICSDASSLPELVGQAARLVAPDRPNLWTEAIVELATRPDERARLSEGGPAQAARFTWQKTAERTLQLYHAAECMMTRGKS